MTALVRFPEVASGLASLIRSLPAAVRQVVTSSTLQRTGCLKCGIGPHQVFQCPFLSHNEAADLERAAYRRWTLLIGEELMMFGAGSSIAAYEEGAKARMAARNDLPRRPPRYMTKEAAAAPQPDRQTSSAQKAMVIDSPILPLPSSSPISAVPPIVAAAASRPSSSYAPFSQPLPKPATSNLRSMEISQNAPPSKQFQLLKRVQAPNGQASSRLMHTPNLSSKVQARTMVMQADPTAAPAHQPIRAGTSAESSNASAQRTIRPACSAEGSSAVRSGSSTSSAVSAGQASAVVVSDDFDTQESWDANNERLDGAIAELAQLSQHITRLTGDLEMMKAHTIGERRSRPFTPGSSERPAKIQRDLSNAEHGQALEFAGDSTQQILEGIAGERSDGADDDGSDAAETTGQFESWDIARYKRAKTEKARGKFWDKASLEAKQRMTQSLLAEPDMSPVTVQARKKGWIPF